ncbi:6-phosphofructokinase [Pseudidiomarina indica]|uniref:6-phosphofructokinase n=1 Tax=Pseudidiomarina indica TaxID=1159017 RepID=A0A1G6CYQ8_9GAMM|nr:ATP-dependent 6-phosphofructokinase [Pseudidiomarina indica]SDB37951.1 6-phosphofructokinase [Pseudidiomarina indica]
MSESTTPQRIGILTSGGDAPGMNAAIRAIVLAADHYDLEVIAFRHGFEGLLEQNYLQLTPNHVQHILQYSGTIIKSARCPRFKEVASAQQAARHLAELNIGALIVIGGDGSFRGAHHLSQHWDGQVIGVPGTIDNDVYGTDSTVGYSTAVAIAMDALDKIRDTADAMDRVFIVEVMGRNAGFIGLKSAMAAGAERMILPELQRDKPLTIEAIVKHIKRVEAVRGQGSYVMVLSEHQWPGGAVALSEQLEAEHGMPCRPCLLGHIQRGGPPTATDRVLASELGVYAVELIREGARNVMTAMRAGALTTVTMEETWSKKNPLPENLLRIQHEIFNPVKKSRQPRG